MNENNQVAVVDTSYSIMPRNMQAQISEAIQMRDMLNSLFENLLEPKVDFDRIPGTDKPTLLKPGAELLCKVFKLAQGKADVLEKNEDWEKGIFSYVIGMPLIHIESGMQIAYGVGSANGYEKKYRYRKVNGVQTENPDPADMQNTLIKMANKRALVDAVLKATGASRMFTQDLEEFRELAEQFEKASTKQVGFIKSLFGNAPESAVMAECSTICGREIKTFDDISRNDASRIIEAKKGSGGNPSSGGYTTPTQGSGYSTTPPASGGEPLNCADCSATITQAEHGYSSSKFGRPLCRKCQAAAKSTQG